MDDARQILVAERGPLLFVFNFSPFHDYEGLEVPAPVAGRYRAVLDSDSEAYGGRGRLGRDVDHFTQVRLDSPLPRPPVDAVNRAVGRGEGGRLGGARGLVAAFGWWVCCALLCLAHCSVR